MTEQNRTDKRSAPLQTAAGSAGCTDRLTACFSYRDNTINIIQLVLTFPSEPDLQ